MFEVLYCTDRVVATPGFSAIAVHAFSSYGTADAGQGLVLTEAPDAVLALVLDDFDEFVAAVERAIWGALFLSKEEREERKSHVRRRRAVRQPELGNES
jgi:hypothetical protein